MNVGIRKRTKAMMSTTVLTVLFILSSAMGVLADDTTKFVPGTKVNGIGIGGLSVEEAKVQIEGFYSSAYKLTITEKNGRAETITGADIGYKASAPEGLSTILDAQNASGRVSGPDADNSHQMEIRVLIDQAALDAKIQALSCISGSDIVTTSDARISAYQEGQPFTIIPEVYGNNLDVEKTTGLIKEAVNSGKNGVDLVGAGCYYSVSVTADNQQLKELCDLMNRYKGMTITYSFGDKKTELSGSVISSWILGSADGQIQVNRDLAAAFVKTLADEYDTAGKTRKFRTTVGKDVDLSGPYGWKIDQAVETDALIAMIRTGQSQVREPEYSQKASNRDTDWGTSYVEIDLKGQHVYVYKEGALVWDAPCVTGNVSKEYSTPEGIYSLTYKEKDRVLRGEKKPDGTYEYESHVDYWMPFNGGIGLHDASWRGKFGGTIYQYSGSHGCVNLPSAKAQTLYDLVYKGIPVLCYN